MLGIGVGRDDFRKKTRHVFMLSRHQLAHESPLRLVQSSDVAVERGGYPRLPPSFSRARLSTVKRAQNVLGSSAVDNEVLSGDHCAILCAKE